MNTTASSALRAPRVLITRPEGQHEHFASQCKALGFQVELLPCLEIFTYTLEASIVEPLLAEHGMALFTSTNAVHSIHQCLPFPWSGIDVHAIGEATASALATYGQALAMTPEQPYNSEAYLARLRCYSTGSLLIIKGAGGRDLIARHLRERGWRIGTLDTYERRIPKQQAGIVTTIFKTSSPDIISVTSNEILMNLWDLSHRYHHKLRKVPLVCNGERCARLAIELGFTYPVIVASPAGDTGQIQCLKKWIEDRCFT